MDSSEVWSYRETYEHLKEEYLRYLAPPYNFTNGGAFGKTHYEYDPEYYKGATIELIYIVLGLAKLCFEYNLPYYEGTKNIFINFFNDNSLNKITEILPKSEKDEFIKDYLIMKNDFEHKII